jgi:DNA (cytosine-5)-methyltransferase 1
MTLTVLEFFGGIGAPRRALERLNLDFKVLDYVEIDKFAVKSYNAIYGENYKPQDIREWDKDLNADIIFHGSPCQDFSQAGRGAGGEKQSLTRSSLLWETVRIVETIKPKLVIWENVASVLGKNHKPVVDEYLETLENLGYYSQILKLNAKDYGIPQNRKRVFIVSKFGVPITLDLPTRNLDKTLQDFLESNVDEKFNLTSKLKQYINSQHAGNYVVSTSRLVLNRRIASTISTRTGRNRADCSDYISDDFTINENVAGVDLVPYVIRRLTPRECWRLQGFDDASFNRAEQVCSNSQLYKQAGNSIVVDVLCHLFQALNLNDLPNDLYSHTSSP